MHTQVVTDIAPGAVVVPAVRSRRGFSIQGLRDTFIKPARNAKRRKGYSLPELLLGAAVIAAFLVRVYQSYSATNAADKYEDFTQEIGLLNGTIHETYINSPDYSGIDTSGQNFVGNLPRKYMSGTTVTTSYKQPVTFASEKTVNDGDSFSITTKIPASECVKTAYGDMGRNLTSLKINAKVISFMDNTGNSTDAAAATALKTACAGVSGQNLIDVIWIFN